jgi:uncharacterized damage-inducible protein DinB
MVRLEQVLESWRTVRRDTAQAVLDMPGGELGFQPAPELMTFGQIARHVLDAGQALVGLLMDGVEDWSTPGFRETMKQYFSKLPESATAAELAGELNAAVDRACESLARRPAEFYAGMMTRFDGQRVTRLEMLQFTKEHELTHRSQMFVYLRLKGVVPPTTRRRLAQRQAV